VSGALGEVLVGGLLREVVSEGVVASFELLWCHVVLFRLVVRAGGWGGVRSLVCRYFEEFPMCVVISGHGGGICVCTGVRLTCFPRRWRL